MPETTDEGNEERRSLSNLREATKILLRKKPAKEAYKALFYIRRNDKQ